MIDLHMHTLFSDGELIPAELARRVEVMGHRYIAITDHADQSNVEHIVESIAWFCADDKHKVKVLPGAEITHVTPGKIADVINRARRAGAKIVVVHGETIVEPVEKGTNDAAIDAGTNILAHPGMITPETAARAANAGVYLELTARAGHCYTNGHVARIALEAGAAMVFNTDSHAPRDLVDRERAIQIIMAAGLSFLQAREVLANSQKLVEACSGSL
jgi:histidinol phosphatase-like PHP family hydrolase